MNKEEMLKNLLEKWVSRIVDRESLEKKLNSWKVLRVKFWIDPTWATLHIWHAVPVLKLRAFQELWHQIVLIIWDSTAQVGDTSDKDAERPMLQRAETLKNAEDFINQISKILDISKVEVHYNSEWMDSTSFNMVGEIAKNFSVAELLDRDNFSKRYKAGIRISLQEFLYPLMQGWDSVKVKADIEIGGNDQYFNLLAGRPIQEAFWQIKQDIMTFNLIEGTDGRKMSKTYKNFIAMNEKPNEMFVKIMEINDDLIIKYFTHCTTLSLDEIKIFEDRLNSSENPRNIKLDLALEIVKLYHSEEDSKNAKLYFEKVLSEWIIPDEKDIEVVILPNSSYPIITLLKESKLFSTSWEARNAVEWGWVKINNEVINDIKYEVQLDLSKKILIQVGKKKFKNILKW